MAPRIRSRVLNQCLPGTRKSLLSVPGVAPGLLRGHARRHGYSAYTVRNAILIIREASTESPRFGIAKSVDTGSTSIGWGGGGVVARRIAMDVRGVCMPASKRLLATSPLLHVFPAGDRNSSTS